MATEVRDCSGVYIEEHHHPVTLLEGQAEAVEQTVSILLSDGEFVGLYLYTMELVAVELHTIGNLS